MLVLGIQSFEWAIRLSCIISIQSSSQKQWLLTRYLSSLAFFFMFSWSRTSKLHGKTSQDFDIEKKVERRWTSVSRLTHLNYCLSYFEGGGLEEEDYARDVHGGGVIGSHNGKLGLRCTFLMRDLLILIFGVIEDEKNKSRI